MRALALLLLYPVTALAQDLEIVTRPEIIYLETIPGTLTAIERAFFHIVIHNVTERPVTVHSLRFELMDESGASLSGRYAGGALVNLFDSAIDRRRIEPTPKETLTIGPDQRKAVTDVFLSLPTGFFGDSLSVEVQYEVDGRTEVERSRTSLTRSTGFTGRLPFDGTWYVASEHGYLDPHQRVSTEMFAYDFVQIGSNGRSYQRDGSRNTDYFAYGKKVLASKGGVVALVRSDVTDNAPGTTNTTAPGGNVVIIDHGDNQYGYYAHLRPAKIPVKAGAEVRAGDVIGEVGNTGDSREPHLHFHVMTDANVEEAQAVPLVFENWRGQAHTRTPVGREPGLLPRGEFVEPLPPAAAK
jgi:murein DD-endopeptidase MepM/ murein hydrolase activator NlpD